jgi:hypothetical protein
MISRQVTVVAERADGGKLRVTCPSWDDAIAVLPGECLALVNIERHVHVLRAKAPLPPQHAPPPAPPLDPGEDDFPGPAKADKVTVVAERTDGGKLRVTLPPMGRRHSRPSGRVPHARAARRTL